MQVEYAKMADPGSPPPTPLVHLTQWHTESLRSSSVSTFHVFDT